MSHPTNLRPEVGEEQVLRIREEIAVLEDRLDDMGGDGDCAYERAMSCLYAEMLKERKRQLAALDCISK